MSTLPVVEDAVPVNVLPHPALSIDDVRAIAHHNRFGIRIRRTREGTRILFTRPAGEFELDFTEPVKPLSARQFDPTTGELR